MVHCHLPRKPCSPWRTQSEQCSPSAARPGRRSLCPLAASAQPLFSPLSQPAVTERVTEWCAPPRCPAWPRSWQTPLWTSSALGTEKPSTVSALGVSVWQGLGQGDVLLYIPNSVWGEGRGLGEVGGRHSWQTRPWASSALEAVKLSAVSVLVVCVTRAGTGWCASLHYLTVYVWERGGRHSWQPPLWTSSALEAEKPSTVSALVVSVWQGLGQGDVLLYITQQAEKLSTVSALVVCGEGWDRVMCFRHKKQQSTDQIHTLYPPPPPPPHTHTHSPSDINSSALTYYIHTTPTHTKHRKQLRADTTHTLPPPPHTHTHTPSEETQTAQLWQTTSTPHPPHTPSQKKRHSADTLDFTATAVSVTLTSPVSHQSLHTAVQFVQLMVQGFNLLLLLLKPLQHTQTQRRPPLVMAAERAPTSTEGSNSIHSSG